MPRTGFAPYFWTSSWCLQRQLLQDRLHDAGHLPDRGHAGGRGRGLVALAAGFSSCRFSSFLRDRRPAGDRFDKVI
jgi:hypothetical protein